MEGLIVKENSPWHDFVLSYIFMEPLSWQSFCITHIAEDSGGWWWKGRPGMLQFRGLQRVGHGWVTELNWYHKGILELKLCFNKPNHVLLEAKASKSGQNPVAWQPGWKGLLPESTDTSAFWVEDRRLELRSEKDWFPPTVSAVYLPVTRCSSSRHPLPAHPDHPIPEHVLHLCLLLPELLWPLPPFCVFKPFLLWIYFTDSRLACSYLNFLSLTVACRLIIWWNSFP